MKRKIAISLVLWLWAAAALLALEVPSKPRARVNDYANVLTSDQTASLENKLKTFENETTTQVVVAIFPSLEEESLEDFSIRLAERWKIGTKRDNGAILLVFVKERKMRMEVGYGLEGSLTDAVSSSILRDVIAPRFRQGDYFGGIDAGVDQILAATKGEYKAPPRRRPDRSRSSRSSSLLWVVFFIFLFFFLPMLISGSRRRRGWYTFGSGGWYSGGGGWGGSSGGGGSDGGFSGGGGSFGGGGASGDW